MQVSAYQFLDIVCEYLADAGTASDPRSKLRRERHPQALHLPVHSSRRLVSAKRQAVAGGAGLADGSVQNRLNTYAVLRQVPVGGLKSTPFSGKGPVCELAGPRVLRRESGRRAGQNYDSVPKCRHILCLAHHPDCKKRRLIGHTNSELTIKNEGAILNSTF